MVVMKFDARNIIIGFALLGAVALGTWNVLLQRENKHYQAALQSEKKYSSQISEDNKKEIEDLRGKLIESDRKNTTLKEKIDKEVSELTMSLNARNKQISVYENRIKSYEEDADKENADALIRDLNERYTALEEKFEQCADNNSLLSSDLQISRERYREINEKYEGMLKELDSIDSDSMSKEILDSKENPYPLLKEELEKGIKKYGDDESFNTIRKKEAIRYFSENIRNLNLIFTNIADDTLFYYDKHHKFFHPASIISQESENDLEDLMKTGAHVYGVRVNDLSFMEEPRVFNILKKGNRDSSVLIDLVMEGEKGRDIHPDARLRFFRWGNNNAVQKTENLVSFYEKSLGDHKDRLRGVIHLNKSAAFYVFSKNIFKAFRDSIEPEDEKHIYHRIKKGILSRDFWMENYHDISVNIIHLDMDLVDVNYFIDWDDNQDEINKKLIDAIERSKNERTHIAVDFSNKTAIRQITYLLGKS